MALTRDAIEAMAPDQSALAAASKLLQPAKWPSRVRAGGLIWGECQGSGANPYRVVADIDDPGSKCTCPSRKFPCKHALALMWMFVEDEAVFRTDTIPDWVTEWMGRRRKASAPARTGEAKSLEAARAAVGEAAPDPEAEARKKVASEKRAQETRRSVLAATEDLEMWIADQLRTGLTAFLADVAARCRRIAARLVDAKAGALASRLDELPSRLLVLPAEERIDAAIQELGKLVLLVRAWRAAPDDPELRREVIASEAREEVLNDPQAPRVTSVWEVLGERVAARRDGLVSQTTWLLNLAPGPHRFAMLLDFFPASAGRRSSAFVAGQRFSAELAFYPSKSPLRAVIATRGDPEKIPADWPHAPEDPLAAHAEDSLIAPWRIETPLLLPSGRVCADAAGRAWWRSTSGQWAPLGEAPPLLTLGAAIEHAAGIWNGMRLTLIAAHTNWGRLSFDG